MTIEPTAVDLLRAELLDSGLYDSVPLVEVHTLIGQLGLTDNLAARQELALATIQSLVSDHLMQFEDWTDVPLDEAMARAADLAASRTP